MVKQLIELIKKHESSLAVDSWAWDSPGNFTGFAEELVGIADFRYGKKEMEFVTAFLLNRGWGVYPRYNVLEMVVRRKAMDCFGVEKRRKMWYVVSDNLDIKKRQLGTLLQYINLYGFETAESDVMDMQGAYEKKVNVEFEKIIAELKSIGAKDAKKRGRAAFLDEVQENHLQISRSVIEVVLPNLLRYVKEAKAMCI